MAAASRTGAAWLLDAIKGGLREAVRHKSSTHVGSQHDQTGAAVYKYDGSSWWIPLRNPGRLQFVKRDNQSKLTTIVGTDGHHDVHAQLTKSALNLFHDSIGKAFSACRPGEVLSIEECRLMVTEYGTFEDQLSFHIDKFGLVQGGETMPRPARPQAQDDAEVKRLVEKLTGPDDVISLSDVNDLPRQQESQFMSQIVRQRSNQTKRAFREPQPDIMIAQAPNLAEPVAMHETPSNDQAGRLGDNGLDKARQNLYHLLSAGKVSSPTRKQLPAERASRAIIANQKASPSVQKPSKKTTFFVAPAQKSILERNDSWQYPLPDVSGTSKLLPTNIFKEFQSRYYTGHLRPTLVEKDVGKSENTNAPCDQPQLPRLAKAQLPDLFPSPKRHRERSVSSERSAEPVEWSQSVPPSSPPGAAMPLDNPQDEDWRPIDSSNPVQQPHIETNEDQHPKNDNWHTGKRDAAVDAHLNDDDSSDENLEESIPYVLGDHRGTDAPRQHPKRPEAQRRNSDIAETRRDPSSTPQKPTMCSGRTVAVLSSPHFHQSEMQVPATIQPTRTTSSVQDPPKEHHDTSPQTPRDTDTGIKPQSSSSTQSDSGKADGHVQFSPQATKKRVEEQLNVAKRAPSALQRTRNLGFGGKDHAVEDPTLAVRRERHEFLEQQQKYRDSKHNGVSSPQPGVTESHRPDATLQKPPEHHSWPASPKPPLSAAVAIDGHLSRPVSRDSPSVGMPVNDGDRSRERPFTRVEIKTARKLSDAQELPNKKRRLENHATTDETRHQSVHSMGTRSSPQSSIGPVTDDDTFVAFARAYPEYEEGRKHFRKMCTEVQSLGKNLHKSLWDDYVVRSVTDYDESCGLSYKDFYDDYIDEPTYTKRVLNPITLKTALEASRDRSSMLRSSLLGNDTPQPKEDIVMKDLEMRSRHASEVKHSGVSTQSEQHSEENVHLPIQTGEHQDVSNQDRQRNGLQTNGDLHKSSASRVSANVPTTSAVTIDKTFATAVPSTQQNPHLISSVTVHQPASSAPIPGQQWPQSNSNPSPGNQNQLSIPSTQIPHPPNRQTSNVPSSSAPPANQAAFQKNSGDPVLARNNPNPYHALQKTAMGEVLPATPAPMETPTEGQASKVNTPASPCIPLHQPSSNPRRPSQVAHPTRTPQPPANRQTQRQRPASTSKGVRLSQSSPRINHQRARASLPAQTPLQPGRPPSTHQSTATAPEDGIATDPLIRRHPVSNTSRAVHQCRPPAPPNQPPRTTSTSEQRRATPPAHEQSLTATFRQRLQEVHDTETETGGGLSAQGTETTHGDEGVDADADEEMGEEEEMDEAVAAGVRQAQRRPKTHANECKSTGNAFLDLALRQDAGARARYLEREPKDPLRHHNSTTDHDDDDEGGADWIAGETKFKEYACALRGLKIFGDVLMKGVDGEGDEAGDEESGEEEEEVDVLAWEF